MPNKATKKKSSRAGSRTAKRTVVRHNRPTTGQTAQKVRRNSSSSRHALFDKHYAHLTDGDGNTHVLVPIEDYEEMLTLSMALDAVAQIEEGEDETEWVDADEFGLQLAAERIARARKAAGPTQAQLGRKLKLPQSQISRIERNPDRTTVRTLKRIAKALRVDVRALV